MMADLVMMTLPGFDTSGHCVDSGKDSLSIPISSKTLFFLAGEISLSRGPKQ
jgi:hypothetical protein